MTARALAAVEHVLAEGLASLATSSSVAELPGPELDGWDLPAPAKATLSGHGLHATCDDDLSRFVAAFQPGVRPEVEADGEEHYLRA